MELRLENIRGVSKAELAWVGGLTRTCSAGWDSCSSCFSDFGLISASAPTVAWFALPDSSKLLKES